jgi:hypothetical protein
MQLPDLELYPHPHSPQTLSARQFWPHPLTHLETQKGKGQKEKEEEGIRKSVNLNPKP